MATRELTEEEIRQRVDRDPDFVNLPLHDYSLEKAMERYPAGMPPHLIAKGLQMSHEEVDEMLEDILDRMREAMGVGRGEHDPDANALRKSVEGVRSYMRGDARGVGRALGGQDDDLSEP